MRFFNQNCPILQGRKFYRASELCRIEHQLDADVMAVPRQVVVLGAGFAGIFAALKLAREGAQVLLVDRDERFVFLPLLYEYALGDASRDEVHGSLFALRDPKFI